MGGKMSKWPRVPVQSLRETGVQSQVPNGKIILAQFGAIQHLGLSYIQNNGPLLLHISGCQMSIIWAQACDEIKPNVSKHMQEKRVLYRDYCYYYRCTDNRTGINFLLKWN